MMKKGDFLLICILLCLGIAGFFVVKYMNREAGGTLTVTVDGDVYETYSLQEEQDIRLEIDGWMNRFIVQDGQVRMVEADCPDQYCVEHAPIDKVNETIVCLPHKVVLEITSGSQEKEVDA